MSRPAATIVVLEENPAAQELSDQALRGSGHRILVTDNPLEILGLARRVRIDVLVGDIDQVEAAEPMLAESLRSIARVVEITGPKSATHATPNPLRVLEAPFALRELQEAVAAALDE